MGPHLLESVRETIIGLHSMLRHAYNKSEIRCGSTIRPFCALTVALCHYIPFCGTLHT